MPLEKREPLSVSHEGKTLEGVRLIFRVGRSEQLAQVVDYQGRQLVDEAVYLGEDRDRMMQSARELLLKLAG